MQTLKNTQRISLIFFITFGLTHIVSGLMAANNQYIGITDTITKILDIPFAITGILYGITTFKLENPQKKHTMLNALLIIGIITALAALIYINFFVPDLNAR